MPQYVIKKGDNLSKIAQQFGTTVDALAQSNNIKNRNLIYAGAALNIPESSGGTRPLVQPNKQEGAGVIPQKQPLQVSDEQRRIMDSGGSLPMQQGEREFLTQKYAQGGYTPEQAAQKTNQITQTRTPYAGEPMAPPGQTPPLGPPIRQLGQTGAPQQQEPENEMDTLRKMAFAALNSPVYDDEEKTLRERRQAILNARFGVHQKPLDERQMGLRPNDQLRSRQLEAQGLQDELGGIDAGLKSRETARKEKADSAYKALEFLQKEREFAGKGAEQPVSIKEYEYAKQQGYKGSFQDYQNEDANRKSQALTAGQINSTINSIAGAFDNEPIVKNYNEVQQGFQTINTIGVNTSSPADDIAFIYAFAKIMDPGSVVREGEYNTIQKYAQSWAQNFGFKAARIFSNTNFLGADAKQKMLNALKPKVTTIEKQYRQVRKEYQRQMDDAYAGKPRQITEYSSGGDDVDTFLDSFNFEEQTSLKGTTKKLAAIPNNTKGGQCGRFVNKLTKLGLGDSYASKMAKMDKKITQPEPGMVFVMPYGEYGHTGFILSVKDGIATVKDSNYFIKSAPETVRTHQIPVDQMTGFRRVNLS